MMTPEMDAVSERPVVLVCSPTKALFEKIRKALPRSIAQVIHASDLQSAQKWRASTVLLLIDPRWLDLPLTMPALLDFGCYSSLVLSESDVKRDVPELVTQGLVDDLLLLPLRPIELLGKLRHAQYREHLREVVSANSNLKSLIEKMEEDVRIARSIQRTVIPEKFPAVHGFKVSHKYLSGMRSGGDYLDFFEFGDKTHVGILMSDSTGYGLSSAFLSVMLKLGMKLTKEQATNPSYTVKQIMEELQVTLKPKEQLSLFYGVLNRKTFELQFVSTGSIAAFLDGELLTGAQKALTKESSLSELVDQTIWLKAGGRFVLMSDGFSETTKEKKEIEKKIQKTTCDDPLELINHFVYQVKSKLENADDFPEQDCSIMVVDIEKTALRLALNKA